MNIKYIFFYIHINWLRLYLHVNGDFTRWIIVQTKLLKSVGSCDMILSSLYNIRLPWYSMTFTPIKLPYVPAFAHFV